MTDVKDLFKAGCLLFVLFIIASCGGRFTSRDVSLLEVKEIETDQARPTEPPQPTPTRSPTRTTKPTRTATPTRTPIPSRSPTAIPTSTPTPAGDRAWAVNRVASQTSANVELTVQRLVVGYKDAFPERDFTKYEGYVEQWAEIDVVGKIVFKVTNNRTHTVVVHPERGWLNINDELISLDRYVFLFGPEFGDNELGGELAPGKSEVGEMWFGIRNSVPETIFEVIYSADAAWDANTQDFYGPEEGLGPDYFLRMEVLDHQWVPEE